MASDIQHPPVIGPDHQLPPGARTWPARLWIVGLILLGVVVAVAAVLIIRRRHPAARTVPTPTVSVTAATARQGDIEVHLDAIGTVTAVYTAFITSQVTGVVMSVHYVEGQHVTKGEPLVDIDSRLYRAQLLQAQGTLKRDEHVLAQARMDLARYQAAWARRAIAKQTLDDQYKIVQQNIGVVMSDRGTVEFNRAQVAYSHITAPIEGRVGLRLVDPGNLVQGSGSTTLVAITQMTPITVVFTISQDDLGAVRERQRENAELGVVAYDRTALTQIATGKLLAIDNQVDTTTGTVKARAVFANTDEALFPNEFVNTRLQLRTLQGVILLPLTAVQQSETKSFVYVIENGVAHIRPVKVGVTDRGAAQVEGVRPGEVVADSNFERLREGAAVVVESAAPAPATSGSAPP